MRLRYPAPMHEEDDDSALFRAAVGKVDPLRIDATPPPAKPRPRPAVRREAEPSGPGGMAGLLAESPDAVLLRGDASAFRRERVNARDWQRLRRGQFSAQDELDLHGANALEAELLVARFLGESRDAGFGCVRIVHGKGGADGVPVLKNLVDRLLRQRGEVLAFHSAPPAQGGTGALLVLLSRR
ncbi:Smr protein/MutS2 [Pseudoxanthomonas suwonensis 11-1]|uniref:Smr protein/MutS2 n=1 Tax=Pseudoxanthomonas suwonensis (strain 11-1) TaxID=743721 RepID=E6WQX2_PSEUU|nr:Smr/MutS family protein [Pseudoxanthomonas suwonensis]ADV26644.1 Smr protein/MutS2 [Pseudoxanthomonas suwonensis 11-1]